MEARPPRPTKATVHWDEDAVEVELVLEGGEGREGRAVLTDAYVRYDAETGELLSVILPIAGPRPAGGPDAPE